MATSESTLPPKGQPIREHAPLGKTNGEVLLQRVCVGEVGLRRKRQERVRRGRLTWLLLPVTDDLHDSRSEVFGRGEGVTDLPLGGETCAASPSRCPFLQISR